VVSGGVVTYETEDVGGARDDILRAVAL